MWYEINNDDDIMQFMNKMNFFHDSCIKEMSYLSGAYVGPDLSMFPINNQRILRVIIQRQYNENSMIEMEFQKLKTLKLLPIDDNYTCEILDSTMFLQDGYIYWCDCGCLWESDSDSFTGTLICASKLRWRSIKNNMGNKCFYKNEVDVQSDDDSPHCKRGDGSVSCDEMY